MFCNKCGSPLEDGAFFCSECGEKCQDLNSQTQGKESIEPSVNNQESGVQESNSQDENFSEDKQKPLFMEPEKADETVILKEEDNTPSEEVFILPEKPKKAKKFFKIFAPIISGIAVIVLFALIFGKAIFFAVAPEMYVAGLIKNTSDEISKEMNQIEKNIFGFDVTMSEEMTAGAKMVYKDAHTEYDFNFNVANDPKGNKFLFDGNFENDYGKGSGQGFIGNETAGIMLPGSDKKYLSIPTKDFGKEFKSADGFMTDYMSRNSNDEREQAYDIISTLDLSYDNLKQIFSADRNTSKRINKHVKDSLISLLKDSDIGSRQKTEYDFEGKTKTAYEITLTVEREDLYNCYIKTLKDVASDDKLKKIVDYNQILDIIEELEDEIKESDSDVSDYEIKLIEYKGKIVSMEIVYTDTYEYIDEYSEYNDFSSTTETEYSLTICTINKSKILNGIKIIEAEKSFEDYKDSSREDYSRDTQTEISFASDWATKRKLWDKDIITVAMLVTSEYDSGNYSSSSEATVDFLMDFKKEDWTLDIKSKHKGDDDSSTDHQSFDGKCSKKDGFSFTVNEKWTDTKYDYTYGNSMTYDEWIESKFDSYRNDYLRDIYDEKYWYNYDSYYEWYNSSSRDLWDSADSYFEEWLYDEYYYYSESLYAAYNNATETSKETSTPVDAHVKFEFSLKNKVDIKEKDGKNNNILDWSERDFNDFGEAFIEAIEKK